MTAGKAFGSGTDADVFVKLGGSSTSFGPYQLPAGPEAFETGCKDTFRLTTPDIGELQELTVFHNNMGSGAAWFLQSIELTNLSTAQKYVFKVAAWLDVANGLSRTLKPSKQLQVDLTGMRGDGTQGLLSVCCKVDVQLHPMLCTVQVAVQ